MIGLISEEFLLGIALAWGPCLAYCIWIVLPIIFTEERVSWETGLSIVLTFSVGRAVSYLLLSILAVISGKVITHIFFIAGVEQYFTLAGGVLVVLLGVSSLFLLPLNIGSKRIISSIKSKSYFVLGVAVGLSPCAPLLTNLLYLMLRCKTVLEGAVAGLAFSLGTTLSPLIILSIIGGMIPQFVYRHGKLRIIGKILSYIACLILIVLGIKIILSAVTKIRGI
jgi:cytochrome c biogenesis protein CcdA